MGLPKRANFDLPHLIHPLNSSAIVLFFFLPLNLTCWESSLVSRGHISSILGLSTKRCSIISTPLCVKIIIYNQERERLQSKTDIRRSVTLPSPVYVPLNLSFFFSMDSTSIVIIIMQTKQGKYISLIRSTAVGGATAEIRSHSAMRVSTYVHTHV